MGRVFENKNTSDVDFVIVNFNTLGYLKEMLDFFEQASLPFSYRLIVVDNGSTDGSIEYLDGRDGVTVIKNRENLGYARAVNLGIAGTVSRYVCFMNTDLVLNEQALRRVWDFMESTPGAEICSPVIYSANGRIQGFFFRLNIVFEYLDFPKSVYSAWSKAAIRRSAGPLRFDGVIGAFVFFRASLAGREKKLLDEDYFFYFEDADLAFRLKKAGIRTYVLPGAGITHLGSEGGGGGNNCRLFYRHKYLFIRKNYGRIHAGTIRRIDYFKAAVKSLKYAVLGRLCPCERTREKFRYYRDLFDNMKDLSRSGSS